MGLERTHNYRLNLQRSNTAMDVPGQDRQWDPSKGMDPIGEEEHRTEKKFTSTLFHYLFFQLLDAKYLMQ